MKLIAEDELNDFTLPQSVVTMGNYDGLHLGHRKIMDLLVNSAKEWGLPAVVVSFRPHPLKVLQPQLHHQRMFSFDDLGDQLEKLGLDYLVLQKFDEEFANKSPHQFVHDWLWPKFNPKFIVVGEDFNFGKRRTGNIEVLSKYASELGGEVHVCSDVLINGERISSTRIRSQIVSGSVRDAAKMLGRNFYISGKVVHGDGRGKKIGIATANLDTRAEVIPQRGVYATKLCVGEWSYKSVTNIGYRPTFKGQFEEISIESHILDVNEIDIYDKVVKLEFFDRIRKEMKFTGADKLLEQIQNDISVARRILED